jgi:hypothetical protein
MLGGGTNVGISSELWAFEIKDSKVRPTQWTLVDQKGETPPAMSGFAYASYVENGKLKFAVCKGLALTEQVNDVFM